jgi:hypothetical protein
VRQNYNKWKFIVLFLSFWGERMDFAQQPNAFNARADASERMLSAFEARAHADWVREKVAESLADPRPNIPHAQVMAEAQALIDSKRKAHVSKAAP